MPPRTAPPCPDARAPTPPRTVRDTADDVSTERRQKRVRLRQADAGSIPPEHVINFFSFFVLFFLKGLVACVQ